MLAKQIQELYNKVNGVYGYRRMTMNISRQLGMNYNHKRIYRIMNSLNLKAVIRIKKKKYTHHPALHVAENILNRDFKASAPNEKWVTDVTEFKVGNKKLYLSAIMDLYDNLIVGFSMSRNNNNELVHNTLNHAMKLYPKSQPLLHSDRGFQYTSPSFKAKLTQKGLKQSMSRVGKCIDNGPIEGFWGIIKSEMYYLNRFNNYEGLEKAIIDYIEFYNTKRLQKRLNSQTPMEYRFLAAS